MTFLLAYMLTGVIYLATGLAYRPGIVAGCEGKAGLSLWMVFMFSVLWVPAILVVLWVKLWQS